MIMIRIKSSTRSSSRGFSTLLLCVVLLLNSYSVTAQSDHKVTLSPEEIAYLKKTGPVIIGVDPQWEPYEYINSSGEYSGIAADLLKIIAERAGIELTLMPSSSWSETLEKSKRGKCHILTFLNSTPEREKWLLFTEPYFTDYNVFITREEHEPIANPATLVNKTIVLPQGTSVEERVRREFPNLRVIVVKNEDDAIKAVNNREADMTLRSLSMAAYIIKREGLFNLKIAGTLPGYKNMLRIGVLHEHPILRDILNKSIATLSDNDIQQAINNHISIKYVSGTNYMLLIRLSFFLLTLLLIGLVWNRQLRKLNKKLAARERELRESEKRLSGMVSNLPGFVYSCKNDLDYQMDFISEGCIEITGYSPQDFTNKRVTFGSLILPEEIGEIRDKWERVLAQREHFEHEYRIRNSGGEIIWIWERGFGVFSDAGDLIRLEGFICDITAKRESQEALQVSEKKLISINNTKDKFFSIIAHDLKSPLGTISAFSDYINDTPLSPECSEIKSYTSLISRAAKETLELLENLLEWARVQQGTIPFNPEQLSLKDISDRTILSLSNSALNKNISLISRIPEEISVYGDLNMISALFRNLIYNAIKFTPTGGRVETDVSVSGSEIIVSVSDTGIGVAGDVADKLFCREGLISTKGTNNEGGTGLGLVLCKEFAQRHGGRIWVESTEGEGSTFYFTLPVND